MDIPLLLEAYKPDLLHILSAMKACGRQGDEQGMQACRGRLGGIRRRYESQVILILTEQLLRGNHLQPNEISAHLARHVQLQVFGRAVRFADLVTLFAMRGRKADQKVDMAVIEKLGGRDQVVSEYTEALAAYYGTVAALKGEAT